MGGLGSLVVVLVVVEASVGGCSDGEVWGLLVVAAALERLVEWVRSWRSW